MCIYGGVQNTCKLGGVGWLNGCKIFLFPVDPPQITQHPTNKQNVVCGSQVTFTVAANTDAETLTYQWQRNGTNIDPSSVGVSGITTNTLTINNVQESNTGVYTCVVSNTPKSTTTSNTAKLTLSECWHCVNTAISAIVMQCVVCVHV